MASEYHRIRGSSLGPFALPTDVCPALVPFRAHRSFGRLFPTSRNDVSRGHRLGPDEGDREKRRCAVMYGVLLSPVQCTSCTHSFDRSRRGALAFRALGSLQRPRSLPPPLLLLLQEPPSRTERPTSTHTETEEGTRSSGADGVHRTWRTRQEQANDGPNGDSVDPAVVVDCPVMSFLDETVRSSRWTRSEHECASPSAVWHRSRKRLAQKRSPRRSRLCSGPPSGVPPVTGRTLSRPGKFQPDLRMHPRLRFAVACRCHSPTLALRKGPAGIRTG